jgi:hypothetical protein
MSGGRVSAILDSIRNPKWRLRGRGVLVLFAGATLVAGTWWSFSLGERPQWIDRNPALTAAGWLKSHALSQGVGEYWSANLLTAMSGSASTVRSVVPDKRKLVPYIWVEDWRFYVSAPQFAIWREPNQTGVTETLVRSTYRVCSLTNVAGYRIALLSNGGNSMECQPGIRSGQ